jgi:hypothetical protein
VAGESESWITDQSAVVRTGDSMLSTGKKVNRLCDTIKIMSGKSHSHRKRARLRSHQRKTQKRIALAAAVPIDLFRPPHSTSLAAITAMADAAPKILQRIADALNDLGRCGVKAQIAHGAVITEFGYVFPLGHDPAPWVIRSRQLTELSIPFECDPEDA